jgi:hypothetical protein
VSVGTFGFGLLPWRNTAIENREQYQDASFH